MKIQKGKQGGPRRVLFHGTNFIGKTTFASQAFGGALLANLEDDRDVDMDKSPPLRTWDDWQEFWLYCDQVSAKGEFPYRWIAIDTLDALERIIDKQICKQNNAESMADAKFSYGKAKEFRLAMWDKIKFQLDWLHTERGLGIILLAHSEAVKESPPDAPSYDRWQPAMNCAEARDMLCDWCQEVFFGSFRNYTVKEDAGFNRTRNIAAGGTERVIRTQPTAGVRAKNRLNMPEEMTEFSFEKYAEFFVPSEVLKGNSNG